MKTDEKVIRLDCAKCRWQKTYTPRELTDLGVPWYCDDCGQRVTHFKQSEGLIDA